MKLCRELGESGRAGCSRRAVAGVLLGTKDALKRCALDLALTLISKRESLIAWLIG